MYLIIDINIVIISCYLYCIIKEYDYIVKPKLYDETQENEWEIGQLHFFLSFLVEWLFLAWMVLPNPNLRLQKCKNT